MTAGNWVGNPVTGTPGGVIPLFHYVRAIGAGGGMAIPVGGSRAEDRPLLERVMFGERIEAWPERVYEVDGPIVDLQPEIRGLRLCSQRLKDVLEAERSSADDVQWLEAQVRRGDETRPYWVLHFPSFPDVVDPVLSTYQHMDGVDFVNQAVFDLDKAQPHRVMPSPQRFPTVFVVAEAVKRRLVEEGFIGLDFEVAAASLV